MDHKRLEQGLESGNLREASLVISEASQHKDEEIVVLLIKHLRVTENKLLRNEIAIALKSH
ncbi:hypothetical protein ACFSL6_04510 [Paenibacillus thailandensis]|uniref:Uncharacterized protein n=1 Tax=Paenibacillus thailandensis TaxID=393250 RepID=A0ABW5QZ56_9BACL